MPNSTPYISASNQLRVTLMTNVGDQVRPSTPKVNCLLPFPSFLSKSGRSVVHISDGRGARISASNQLRVTLMNIVSASDSSCRQACLGQKVMHWWIGTHACLESLDLSHSQLRSMDSIGVCLFKQTIDQCRTWCRKQEELEGTRTLAKLPTCSAGLAYVPCV